jgi:hypothetical protein
MSVHSRRLKWNRTPSSITEQKQGIIDARFAMIIKEHRVKRREEQLLQGLNAALRGATVVLDSHEGLASDIAELFQNIPHLRAERSNVRIHGRYDVVYHGQETTGPRFQLVTAKTVAGISRRRMRLGKGIETHVSKSYEVLVGEICQFLAGNLLRKLIVFGESVRSVTQLRARKKKGRRVDDWLLTTRSGRRIPVEVKSTLDRHSFQRATDQLKDAIRKFGAAMFFGVYLPESHHDGAGKRIIILLLTKKRQLHHFRANYGAALLADP